MGIGKPATVAGIGRSTPVSGIHGQWPKFTLS
jgi:hypothetical protein